jgi:general secretion pathway protein H
MIRGARRMSTARRASTVPMTLSLTARTGRKVAREQRPISRAGRPGDGAGREDGFTLLEVVCVVAIIATLAAVLLPRIPLGTSRPRLEAYAIETASLLKADRNAAIRRRIQIATEVTAMSRLVRSGATGQVVRVPDDVVFQAILPQHCNQRPARSTISFFASGMSCGGAVVLTRHGVGYEVRVNWLTGGVEVVARHNP